MNELIREFERIKSTYFPRWDKQHEWTIVEFHPECVGDGYCDSDNRQIVIASADLSMEHILIHEIAHAVTHDYHGKKWQRRMEKAALKAEELGQRELASDIRKDYIAYLDSSNPIIPKAQFIYNSIEDAGIAGQSFECAVASTANAFGMTPHKLLAKYKKAWTVYDSVS
jgi:hypothetical protein